MRRNKEMTFENLKWTREPKEYSIQPEWIEISTIQL